MCEHCIAEAEIEVINLLIGATLMPGEPLRANPSHPVSYFPYIHCEYWVPVYQNEPIKEANLRIKRLMKYVRDKNKLERALAKS